MQQVRKRVPYKTCWLGFAPLCLFTAILSKGLDELQVKWHIPSANRAGIAQLAEHLICNQKVIGSSPIVGSIFLITIGIAT